MKTKIMKALALAAGIVAAAFAYAGDIYDIRPCDQYGLDAPSPAASLANPAGAGTNFYFRVRLQNQQNSASEYVPWVLTHLGANSEAIDWAVAEKRPNLGVYVSGRLVWAELVSTPQVSGTNGEYTDLIYKYTTKQGDFALPMLLATASGPASDDGAGSYIFNDYLLPQVSRTWSIARQDDATTEVEMNFFSGPGIGRSMDYSLSKAGFYVQTINFDDKAESEDGSFWRYVHAESNITSNYTPKVVMKAASSEQRTVYVWSTNDSAVRVNTTRQILIADPTDDSGATSNLTYIAELVFEAGVTEMELPLWGVTEGGEAELVLSAYPYYRYSEAQSRFMVGAGEADFVKVAVKCVEPMPPTVMVVADTDTMAADSTSDLNAGATLSVYLTQPISAPLDVTVTPGAADFVKMSDSAKTVKTVASLYDEVTVTLPAGSSGATTAQKIYVFALKGGQAVDFVPTYTDTTGEVKDKQAAAIDIVAANPAIVSPAENAEIGATAGVDREIEIEVADTYADRQLADPAAGYKIEVKYSDSLGWKELEGPYYIGTGDILRDKDGKLPVLNYPNSSTSTSTGTFTTSIRITEPINQNKATVKIIATVEAPKTANVTADAAAYDEGGSGTFTISLSAPNDTGASLYAYLVAVNELAKKDKFEAQGFKFIVTSDMTDEQKGAATGLEIPKDQQMVTGDVKFLDGGLGGSTYYFKVVLCQTSTYGTAVSGYNSNTVNVKINNVEPTITRVELNNEEPGEDGWYPSSYPVGISQKFQAVVTDPGQYDLEATAEADQFRTRWNIKRAGGAADIFELKGNPNDISTNYTFKAAGDYTITVQVRDKDMSDWATVKSETYVKIIAQPQLTITLPDGSDTDAIISENAKRERILVGLGGYYASTDPIVVMVTVEPNFTSTANPGKFVLDASRRIAPEGYEAYQGDNKYFLTFSSADALPLAIEADGLDGTDDASGKGYKITAQVLNGEPSTDPTMPWSDYYLKNSRCVIYVDNVEPVVTATEENGTNYWTTAKAFSWSVKNTGDVSADFEGIPAHPGIHVVVDGDLSNKTNYYITAGESRSYTPDFGVGTGILNVTLTISDKDGGEITRTYSYNIPATKTLTTSAVGPSGGNASIALSQVYANADGRGAGHVYVSGAGVAPLDARGWTISWNCKNLNTVNIYGFGYLSGAVDNGTLDSNSDIAITPAGGLWKTGSGAYYTYNSDYDSFPYGWITSKSEGGEESAENAAYDISVAPKFGGELSQLPGFKLPTKQLEDNTGYAETYVEAIFAKEWRVADNMGDINADGIPDYFALMKKYRGGSISTADGTGAELPKADNFNEDLDFYPVARALGSEKLTPNPTSGWSAANVGQPFTALLEVRGYDSGLNFGMFKVDDKEAEAGWISDLDLSRLEKKALFAAATGKWASAAGADAVAAAADADGDGELSDEEADAWLALADDKSNLAEYNAQQAGAKTFINATWSGYKAGDGSTWGFTVENRTDPTVEDSDGDTMPDGYEYYFWYGATVGFDAGVGPLKGMRFTLDPATFETGVEIGSDEIAGLFNPNVRRDWTKQDTDNDGLYDYEEMLVGTSPIFWDTDGDGTSDFFEAYYNINPIAANNNSNNGTMNADGDFMARATIGTTLDNLDVRNPTVYPVYYRIYTAVDGTLWAFDSYVERDLAEDFTEVTTNAFQVAAFNGGYIPVTENTTPENLNRIRTVQIDNSQAYVYTAVSLYHHQVYCYYGFDPRTGWFQARNGSVHSGGRWNRSGMAGAAVNTVEYTALDEFRLLEYRYIVGLRSFAADNADIAADKTTMAAVIAGGTTNPNTPFDNKVWGDYEAKPFAQEIHGADTDADGVPDGWELYIGVNPNISWRIIGSGQDNLYRAAGTYSDGTLRPAIATTDATRDTYDADGLDTLVAEYAGTDSCLAYPEVDTIYANHPSKEGGVMYRWYNKFFPTDPRDADTDGDGVSDANEGRKWVSGWVFDRWGQNGTKRVTHYTVYGLPHDNGGVCIPGGGMNPATIDTDEDGLPDRWEMQFNGLLMNGNDVAGGVFTTGTPDPEIYDDIRAALAAYNSRMAAIDEVSSEDTTSDSEEEGEGDSDTSEEDDTGNGGNYYVIMGMDPTVIDASTRLVTGSRDLDWDGDGLQNWQEYMVQAMRHFRYDDCRTPLMGRDIPAFDETAQMVVPGAWLGQDGYLKMSYTELYDEGQLGTVGETLGYKNFAAYALENPDMLRTLGYFADPPRAWDKAKLKMGFKYMLPPTYYYDAPLEVFDEVETWVDELGTEHELFDLVGADGVVITNNLTTFDEDTGLYSTTHVYTEYVDGVFYYSAVCVHPDYPDYGEIDWAVVPRIVTGGYGVSTVTCKSSAYVSCDPRLWDTDNDGMDDYWELYHGLNPLLGHHGQLSDGDYGFLAGTVSDVIYETYRAYGAMTIPSSFIAGGTMTNSYKYVSAWQNAWTGWNNTDEPKFDPIKAPWMMGTYDCDADGDGFRNIDETILANITTPGTKHTDPTPLWMTDTTVGSRFVESYTNVRIVLTNSAGRVVMTVEGGKPTPKMTDAIVTNSPIEVVNGPSYAALYYGNEMPVPDLRWWTTADTKYIVPFEENEGYDSDSDFKSDGREVVRSTESASDPIDFSDPLRRQSMYFGGRDNPGLAISYRGTIRNSFGQDLFKQFTVEAWVRPGEITDQDQCFVSRAVNYSGWDLLHTNAVIRNNFVIGMDAAGQAFTEFEDSTKRSVRISGGQLAVDTWAHVAATFDGKDVALYVNGIRVNIQQTGLIPANGVQSTTQDPQYNSYLGFPYSTYYVGPAATIIGARALGAGAFSTEKAAEAADWSEIAGDFFKGSIDEVRVWDGARSQADISKSWNKRMTTEEIKSHRDSLFSQFLNGARRNDGTARDVLDPELIQQYTFSSVAGATEPQYVQKIVPGFQTNVLAVVQSPEDGSNIADQVKIGWWNAILTNETLSANGVYTNKWTVPWLQNTVAHLPRLSGILPDSVYWSERYAGYTPASFQGLEKFDFANAMNPYALEDDEYTDTFILMKLRRLASTFSGGTLTRFYYDLRHEFTGTDDLVPVGFAFAKRLEESWDNQGAEDSWAVTSDGSGDLDADPEDTGIPAWAREAYPDAAEYWRALAKGLLPDGSKYDAFKDFVDNDRDGMPDWWSGLYGVSGKAGDDDDKDGLSNYTEYLLSELFDLGVEFDPRKSHSVSEFDSDYFFKIGQLYAGEIFTDHDMMEDAWEAALGTTYTSRYLWDAKDDNDEDGWSAASECRYSEFVSGITAKNITHMINGMELLDFPVPTIELTVRYNGTKRLSETDATAAVATNSVVPLVVKAYHDSTTQAKGALSDAVWTLYPGQTVERVKNLGIWGDRVVRGTLTPGNIDPNSFDIMFSAFDSNDLYVFYLWNEAGTAVEGMYGVDYETYLDYVEAYGAYGTSYYTSDGPVTGRVQLASGGSDWATFARENAITVTSDETTEKGYICYDGERCGEINLVTGEYSLDLGVFYGSSLSGTNGTTTIANSLVRIDYTATVPTMQTQKMTVNLGQPDVGYVREGANDFVAFYDLNGDGKHDPGEPFGYLRGADVGWFKKSIEIEVTDVSPVSARIALWDGIDDRNVSFVDALSSGDPRFDIPTNLASVVETQADGAQDYVHYKLARWTVDGYPRNIGGFPARVVAEGMVNRADLTCLSEREILADGSLDIDWANFEEIVGADAVDLLDLDVTNVTYLVCIGEEGSTYFDRNTSSNIVAAYRNVVTRRFDARRATVEAASPVLTIAGAKPTFSWTISGESDWAKEFGSSYTVFRLRIRDENDAVVYNSGNMRMPACDRNGVYSFTPPVYAGCELEVGKSYTWQVAIKNSKFQSDVWSDEYEFLVNTQQNSADYGQINVCAKYFGPAKVLSGGNVVVEAFTSPDFTGDAAGRVVVASKASVSAVDAEHEANASIIGLPAGTYYVRAYIDSQAYGAQKSLEPWESLGYVCPRENSANEWTYAPTAITVGPDRGKGEVFTCYIEDVDTNRNGLPDAWEMVNNKGTLDRSTQTIDATVSGGIVVNEALNGELTSAEGDGSLAAGLAAHALSQISNAGVAVLALDIDPNGKPNYSVALKVATTTTEVDNDVAITDIRFADGSLTITADITSDITTTTGTGASPVRSTIWTASGSGEGVAVTGSVMYKTDLSAADWSYTGVDVTITVTEDGTVSTGPIDLSGFLEEQGYPEQLFFKIRVD